VQHIVDDLFKLLHAAEVKPPYLLVGHSFGGPIVWAAAIEHSDDVAGFLSMNGVPRAHDWLPRILPRFTRRDGREERAYYRGENDDQVDLIASDARLKGSKSPDDIPYILMHGSDCQGDDLCSRTEDVAVRLDRGLARVSSGGRLVTVDAGHEIYLDKPAAVTRAISDLLDAVTR
jgi:pimeloyl-ACP methyl ester carboxylesterase